MAYFLYLSSVVIDVLFWNCFKYSTYFCMVLRLKNVLKGQGFQIWELRGVYRGPSDCPGSRWDPALDMELMVAFCSCLSLTNVSVLPHATEKQVALL